MPNEVKHYNTVMRAELSPDVYDGDNCDEVRHRWDCYTEGDMDSDFIDVLELDAKQFPPGTKVKVLEPLCPLCHQEREFCEPYEPCDFDWDEWVQNQYS